MSWEREPLFVKSKLFFEKGFDEDKESPFFGLWCAMGLELLARSAVAHISPTLLADPDPSHQNLLHALNLGSTKSKKKSLITVQVLSLCQTLITSFTQEHFKICSAIINQRNEELHTGSAAFDDYPTSQWIAGFYKCCKILSEFQGESLNSLLGDEVEKEANMILSEVEEEVIGKTNSLIASYKKVFENKDEKDKKKLAEESEKNSEKLAYRGHHRVDCPACGSLATVIGEPYGKENVETQIDEIIVRQSILPTSFHCIACELKINGYNALTAANLSNHYTRKTTYSPEEYFNLINPDDYDAISEKFHEFGGYDEYNNE
ncbi:MULTISPECIES: hypothetical protein [Chryseobacterium]|uniref:hypothetical protein n=1 Tax=Chryseobacterium TaxID=59732 RepID=UPI0010F9F4F6|nr:MULTISPECIES: hypothetical protein [Chryseobacterium]WES99321.1 hypothetical protein P2W68_06815 [Chryseobacterium arthrosphaerae]